MTEQTFQGLICCVVTSEEPGQFEFNDLKCTMLCKFASVTSYLWQIQALVRINSSAELDSALESKCNWSFVLFAGTPSQLISETWGKFGCHFASNYFSRTGYGVFYRLV